MRKTVRVALPSVAIFLVAMMVRLGLLAVTKSYLAPEGSEIVNVAKSLALHGEFGNAFSATSGPTAHVSPVYPLLLSVLYRWFGTGQAGEIAQEVFACSLASLLWAWMPVAGRIFGLEKVGVVAGAMGALLPINRWAETKGSFETGLAALTMVLLVSGYAYAWKRRNPTVLQAVALGILSGIAILVSATLATTVAVLLLLCSIRLWRERSTSVGIFALVIGATTLAVLLPWGVRNYYALGGFVMTRSNFGLELQVSNNDLATPWARENMPAFKQYHPHEKGKELARLENMGELAYNREKLKEAVEWIRSHPRPFFDLTLQRFRYFWFPDLKRPAQTLMLRLLTFMAVLGGIRLYGKDRFLMIAFLSVLLSYSLIYYVVQTDARYIYPIAWIIYFLAADCLVGVWTFAARTLPSTARETPV